MITNELLQFVQEQLAKQVPKDRIVEMLTPGGWTATDIDEAIAALQTPAVPLLKTFPQKKARNKMVISIGIILAVLIVVGVIWYFVFPSTLPSFLQRSAVVTEETASEVLPTPQTPPPPFDADMTLSWVQVPDEQNSAHLVVSVGSTTNSADKQFLAQYFSKGYDVQHIPAVASASEVASRYSEAVRSVQEATTPFFQCSVTMAQEQCNYANVRAVGQLFSLQAYALDLAGKIDDAFSAGESLVHLGQQVTANADDVINLLLGFELQQNGYQDTVVLNTKTQEPHNLTVEDKVGRVVALRANHKNVLKILYSRSAEMVDYLTDSNRGLSFPLTAEDPLMLNGYRDTLTSENFRAM
ncbi:MAG: hypothetical protein NUV54_00710, partial [Candidatus Taylorbacteria bacterium]|nr:hypothetical protein [Candidatus Taylorbacteria bacterium]